MLWIVSALVSIVVIIPIRKYLKQSKAAPSGMANAIEAVVKFIRDSIVQPNVGSKYTDTWAPMILTLFFFILFANGIGLIPVFDLLGALNRLIASALTLKCLLILYDARISHTPTEST